jgi:hypothetical protein
MQVHSHATILKPNDAIQRQKDSFHVNTMHNSYPYLNENADWPTYDTQYSTSTVTKYSK